MTVTCVVQARTGSTRLPGKVLADLHGRPMLAFLLDRLTRLRVDNLVVATSDLPQDDPVAAIATERHVDAVRGSEADVLARFSLALDHAPADVVVRITADCPLTDPAIVEAAVELRAATDADYVSNSLVRTFPVGLDVEVVTGRALRQAAAEATDPPEREHVMPFVYRRPERYRLVHLRVPDLLGHLRWTVDLPPDLERVRGMVASLPDPFTAGWRDMLAVAPPEGTVEPAIRPAVADDEQRISSLLAGAPIGTAEPLLPVAVHLLDGQVRTWVVEHGPDLLGWVQVSVAGGLGRLSGRSHPGQEDTVLSALRALLRTDFQVQTWEDGAWPTGGPGSPTS